MKVIVAGGRDFDDYDLLENKMNVILTNHTDVEIVSGTARGADNLGEKYAKSKGFRIRRMPANWDKYGKAAGYRRNAEMAKYADACVCFWDGKSRGTKHMIDLAKKEGIKLRIVHY